MFCNEPIVQIYLGQDEYESREGANSYFDCYHDLAYHVTEGYRIVLITENWAITLDANGVTKESRSHFAARPGEYLQDGIELMQPDDEPYIHSKHTLFVGERLLKVEKKEEQFVCTFDHFSLAVIPYALNTLDRHLSRMYNWSYNHLLGFDRHLKKDCDCGGSGEILLDFVSDYVVRCKNCKKSTWAYMELQSAINDWNAGELNCILDDITIE